MIEVVGLSKTYRVAKKKAGLRASLGALFHREREDVEAVVDLSMSIGPGERVGFLGPNGAGKTTTLKMLSGLLTPTAGRVSVLGLDPRDRPRALLERITLVMGSKQQLLWDLPPTETFELNRAIYDLDRGEFSRTLDELVELLGLAELLEKPVRQLSLGERMKCELASALLHRPQILFLDEPTIGLDVSVQAAVRSFIKTYNERHGATVLLTSHYMADVLELCPRVIVIDKGRKRFDGELSELVRAHHPEKRIEVHLKAPLDDGARAALSARLGRPVEPLGGAALVVAGRPDELSGLMATLLAELPVADLRVEDPPLEATMRRFFAEADTRVNT